MKAKVHITVCICTYKRPIMLDNLLSRLSIQRTENSFIYDIVIVDNDNIGSAKDVALKHSQLIQTNIKYLLEIEKNIAIARNKAINHSIGDFVAFIDDDEFPENDWLLNLLNAHFKYACNIILGPVLPYYDLSVPKWVVKSKLCERPRYKSGSLVNWRNTRTGNALVKKSIFENGNCVFDPTYGHGGSDVKFFQRVAEKGHKIVWCDEAIVHEFVPPERHTLKYFVKRAFLQGSVSSKYKHKYENNNFKYSVLIESLIAVMIYTALMPFALIVGPYMASKILIKDIHHLSRSLAILGLVKVKNRNF